VLHCSQMNYQFAYVSPASVEERALSDTIVQYIYNFAATGNPNTPSSDRQRSMELPVWPKATDGMVQVWDVASSGGVRAAPFNKTAECAFLSAWIEDELKM
jgi:hypothetical protein